MLPPDVLAAVDDMESMTSGNTKWVPHLLATLRVPHEWRYANTVSVGC